MAQIQFFNSGKQPLDLDLVTGGVAVAGEEVSAADELLSRTFDHVRKWAAIQAQLPLDDYDYDAIRAQEACDLEDARRRRS